MFFVKEKCKSMSEKKNIKIPEIGIEIFSIDITEVNWKLANQIAKEMGEGWRLPSLAELRFMKGFRDNGICNFPLYRDFDDAYYWSNKEGETRNSRTLDKDGRVLYAYFFDMLEGIESHNKKSYGLRTRLVRDI